MNTYFPFINIRLIRLKFKSQFFIEFCSFTFIISNLKISDYRYSICAISQALTHLFSRFELQKLMPIHFAYCEIDVICPSYTSITYKNQDLRPSSLLARYPITSSSHSCSSDHSLHHALAPSSHHLHQLTLKPSPESNFPFSDYIMSTSHRFFSI